ncbi:unnamed protein product [Paramecium pentaurelia]|uniref:Transmembrane protein n=1 Tax=Paramecium pentaurelia TaxID=43138 RepID=A0A8S1TUT1_9CILI|nr:unnamed protein product [Paramecium pentaurelia]
MILYQLIKQILRIYCIKRIPLIIYLNPNFYFFVYQIDERFYYCLEYQVCYEIYLKNSSNSIIYVGFSEAILVQINVFYCNFIKMKLRNKYYDIKLQINLNQIKFNYMIEKILFFQNRGGVFQLIYKKFSRNWRILIFIIYICTRFDTYQRARKLSILEKILLFRMLTKFWILYFLPLIRYKYIAIWLQKKSQINQKQTLKLNSFKYTI